MARRPSSGSVGLAHSPEITRRNGSATFSTPKRDSNHLGEAARRSAPRTASLSQKLDSSVNFNDIDPDDLFTKYTVSEIRTVQHRLRAEADAKQEELRLMVGERYRDLLQASTSILALAKSSTNVLEALEEMRDTVHSIAPSRAPKRAISGEDKHLQALQSLSAHVKLLLDAPEHLWRLMERKSYLNAAWLFLLARVVHRALSQDEDDQSWHAYGIDVSEQLPLVQRQWDTIAPFRPQISHRATLFLREQNSTPGEVCATLLTLHLLDARPIPDMLSIYLAQRTKTLSGLLTRNASTSANGNATDSKPNGKTPYRPRKVVVKEAKHNAETVLEAVSRTVGTARLMFADAPSGDSSLMKAALHLFQVPTDSLAQLPSELQLSTQLLLSSLPSSSHLLLLPQNVRAYKPYVDNTTLLSSSLQTQLRDKLQAWFKRALQELRDALADWFSPLESIQEVWSVRSALLQWLKGVEGLDPSEQQELESVINAASLTQATAVWKTALGRLEASFRDSIAAATTALTEAADGNLLDIQPITHLLQAPSIPTGLQAGAHSAATAATQFAKYRSSLRQQLNGRTPLVESALATLERYASEIQEDLAAMQKSLDNKTDLVQQLSDAYRVDAEAVCGTVCSVLETAVAGEEPVLRVSVYVGRISQELTTSSNFFAKIGCGEAATREYHERLTALATKLMQNWRKRTVSKVVQGNLGTGRSFDDSRSASKGDTILPSRPSTSLTEALLSLSSEMQQLGACLDDVRRQQQVGLTVEQFIAAFLARQEKLPRRHAEDLQLLWDATFLRRLARLWETTAKNVLERVDANIARWRESDIDASTQEFLTKTQVLLAPLLPSRAPQGARPTKIAEKSSSLLLFGTPGTEQGFEPALELVKTPPRFGLLLVGGAALR
ncbi:Conserved oligomeric Golgi complex subunit 1 [Trametes pubescens]|uniref:Conserved oligomeric Golgi complex subunit 1 n=1 Tax=Trametes pubescens TaxID=154538 RepID=A0A1M2VR42_TRAPU|nr:Conserved oligomeric Golgi complex subunit 1 [Trametes pubescens]